MCCRYRDVEILNSFGPFFFFVLLCGLTFLMHDTDWNQITTKRSLCAESGDSFYLASGWKKAEESGFFFFVRYCVVNFIRKSPPLHGRNQRVARSFFFLLFFSGILCNIQWQMAATTAGPRSEWTSTSAVASSTDSYHRPPGPLPRDGISTRVVGVPPIVWPFRWPPPTIDTHPLPDPRHRPGLRTCITR